ncbi:cache domain-containing protein [Pseudodesulfovibrio sp. zrk46]|uniref:cache domain-containing protein n=1 Tax=Pseudodesulfovibrio sp. zrk46 TaxID=2725288 RepID=UPI001448A7F3|nr:cache domain-containing protein [Pseudodesulfovibrio sp. zrk46]QJB57728.1 sodium:calcium antiporter [Pseudodesulfovibrio sp. zrk46]
MSQLNVYNALAIILLLLPLVCPKQSDAASSFGTRQSLELVVTVTAVGLGGVLEGEKSHIKQIEVVSKYISPIRFFSDSSGYFFVYDDKGTCVAHATQPKLIGRNLYDLQDENGQYVIREILSVGNSGGGFIEYNWKKPDSNETHDKVVYVAPIPGTRLFIGSGIYFSSLNH